MRTLILRSLASSLAVLLSAAFLYGCSGGAEPDPSMAGSSTEESFDATVALSEVLTFHASFDRGVDADWALGDRQIYTAPSYAEQDQAVPGIGNPSVEVADGTGRFGHALRFTARNQHAIFYKAEDNVAYSSEDWNGTVSFWLSLDPATDLEPGFCDPIQITDAAYNDAAIWVDFTGENPRQFRLGVFGDLDVWNPDGLSPVRIGVVQRASNPVSEALLISKARSLLVWRENHCFSCRSLAPAVILPRLNPTGQRKPQAAISIVPWIFGVHISASPLGAAIPKEFVHFRSRKNR